LHSGFAVRPRGPFPQYRAAIARDTEVKAHEAGATKAELAGVEDVTD
jgi:hypothetical protein